MRAHPTDRYHLEIIKELEKHAGEGTKYQKERDRNYIGTTKFCYSIKSAVKTQIAKKWVRKHPQISPKEFIDLLNCLYQGKSHEEISLAGKLLEILPSLREQIRPQLLNVWLDNLEGWAEVDSLCQSNFSAKEILRRWPKWASFLKQLSRDPNPHKKRAPLVLMTKPVRDSADTRLADTAFSLIESLKANRNILITKAVSWLLRALIKNHRDQVETYLAENEGTLPKIAIRETRQKLLDGKKS